MRIRFICLARGAASSVLVKLTIIAGLLAGMSFLISVKNVFHNAPALSDPTGLWGYGTNAFFHTGMTVKLAVIALVYLGGLLGRDVLRNNWRALGKIRLIKS